MNGIRGRPATPGTNTDTGHTTTMRAGQPGTSSPLVLFVGRRFRPGSCRSAKRNWGSVSRYQTKISESKRVTLLPTAEIDLPVLISPSP